jgi:hypothetical protein
MEIFYYYHFLTGQEAPGSRTLTGIKHPHFLH